MGLSNQAITIGAVYFVLYLLSIIYVVIDKQPLSFPHYLSYFLTLCFTVLLVYDTHCLTSGRCDVWSWIRTTLYCIIPVLVILMVLYAIAVHKKRDESKNTVTYKVEAIPIVKQEGRS